MSNLTSVSTNEYPPDRHLAQKEVLPEVATEAAIAELVEDGELQRHIARVRRVYASRREILSSSLKRAFGDDVEFTPAPGGMALWVHFRRAPDVEACGNVDRCSRTPVARSETR
jgi:DNA-binding transcriptional MocR family regulator